MTTETVRDPDREVNELLRLLGKAHRRLDLRDAGARPRLPGDPMSEAA
jgi:hypothetical protein